MLIAMFIISAVLAGADPAPALLAQVQPPSTRPSRLNPAQIEQLLARLGHPRFRVREEATQQLCTLDVGELPGLVQRYHDEAGYEMKRRIRYIIEYIFHRDQIIGRDGFIGIEVNQRVMADLTDPINNAITRGILVKTVKPGFAAERAGLLDSDVIIAFGDKVVPEDPSTISFIQLVSGHAPGTMANVRVLRPTESRVVTAEVGTEPMKILEGARLDTVPQDVNAHGVWIVNIVPGSPAAALGFKPNEIIRSVNNNRLATPFGGPPPIDGLLRGLPVGSKVIFEVVNTKAVNLTVRLGSRPPEYISDPKDKAEAQGRFLQWWQDQGGDLSLRPMDMQGARMVLGGQPGRISPETSVIP